MLAQKKTGNAIGLTFRRRRSIIIELSWHSTRVCRVADLVLTMGVTEAEAASSKT